MNDLCVVLRVRRTCALCVGSCGLWGAGNSCPLATDLAELPAMPLVLMQRLKESLRMGP